MLPLWRKKIAPEKLYWASIYYCAQSDGLMSKKAGEELAKSRFREDKSDCQNTNYLSNSLIAFPKQ